MSDHLERRRRSWARRASKSLPSGASLRRAAPSGLPFEPLALPADAPAGGHLEALGFPGFPPFTRGIHPSQYLGRLWTMRQYAGFAGAEETNRRYRMLLDRGQTGLSVAFDLPTQMGYDGDHPMARGEVGRVGVAIYTLEDMETLFMGIDLEKVTVSMTINATAPILMAFYVALARKRGHRLDRLGGTVQNDILKEYIARGCYIYPPEASLRLTVDLIGFCLKRMPKWNPISVSGYHIREAGSTAVQELAFTLSNGLAYLAAARDGGLDVARAAERVSFFFNAHRDFFEEIAKFRASRRLWARLLRKRFGISDPRALALRFHVQTAGSTLTAQQPENNVARVAYQALSAILGGAQSLHTNAWDEALGLPAEGAATLALRTQQILADETGAADVIDPCGGAYHVEALTDAMERAAAAEVARIDAMGGALRAVESGYYRREIEASAYAEQRRIEAGRQVVVGVNRYAEGTPEVPPAVLKVSRAVQARQTARLRRFRARRSGTRVRRSLDALRKGARGTGPLMPLLVEAATGGATLGEMSGALREVFGAYEPAV